MSEGKSKRRGIELECKTDEDCAEISCDTEECVKCDQVTDKCECKECAIGARRRVIRFQKP